MRTLTSLLLLSLAAACLAETKDDSKQKRGAVGSIDHGGAIYVEPHLSGDVGVATSSVQTYGPVTKEVGVGLTSGIVAKGLSSGPVYSNIVDAQVANSHGDAPVGYVTNGNSLGGGIVAGQGSIGLASGIYPGGVSSGLYPNVASTGLNPGLGLGYASGFGYAAPVLPAPRTTSHITIEQPIPVPVYHAVGIPITRPVPYHVAQPYPVHVPRPVPVSVPHPVPFNVPRPYPVAVNRPYPVTVPRLVPVPVTHPVPVEVPSPYAVPSPYPVPVRQPFPVEIPIATPVVGVSAATSGIIPAGISSPVGLGGFSSILSGLGLGGSAYSAPITGISSFGKHSGNFHGAPLRPLTGGPAGERWTGLLTNNYGNTAALTHGYGGNHLGAFHSSKLVGDSYRSVGNSFGKGGASFLSSSHRVKVQGNDELYPYP